MTTHHGPARASAGDWLETHGIHGEGVRRGEILEVLGSPDHVRYRVRWDEQHESIVYPADGVTVIAAADAVPHG
jgi:hypothetical protein